MKLQDALLDQGEHERSVDRRARKHDARNLVELKKITGVKEANHREHFDLDSWLCILRRCLESDAHHDCNLARSLTRSIDRNGTITGVLHDRSHTVKIFHLIQRELAFRTIDACSNAA